MPKRSRLKLPPLKLTTDETCGKRLARIRKERGFTQVELAAKIGIIQSLVTSYECDRLRMHPEMVMRFALALGVSTDELLGFPSKRAESQHAQPGKLSLKVVRRLARIEKLSGTKQKMLLHTIDVFLREAEHRSTSS